MTRSLDGSLGEGAAKAYELAAAHLGEQIATFSERFTGTVRANNWAPVASVTDEVLLDRYEASVRTYGAGLIGRVQQQMAVDLVGGRSWTDVARSIAGGQGGGILLEDYYGIASSVSHRQSRLERIQRTELTYAYNRAHHEDLVRADAEDPGYQKTLVSTFDGRTGADSVFVNGQVGPTARAVPGGRARHSAATTLATPASPGQPSGPFIVPSWDLGTPAGRLRGTQLREVDPAPPHLPPPLPQPRVDRREDEEREERRGEEPADDRRRQGAQGLGDHDRAQVAAAGADVDDVRDAATRVPLPSP